MVYIHSESTNPSYNLALEQYVFDNIGKDQDVFMLWQNDNSVIVGVHQNTVAEINQEFVREKGIRVVRRLSGGGAVYHDLGNVNYTFISKAKGAKYDFSSFIELIVEALKTFHIEARRSGRNDATVDNKKFSGNAQYQKNGRVMHHGTILFDSDLTVLSRALRVTEDKFEGKGVKSVGARVTNLKPYIKDDIDVNDFIDVLYHSIDRRFELIPYTLSSTDIEGIKKLERDRYGTFEWNYGKSPPYSYRVERRFPNVGKIEVSFDISESKIQGISFFGDYFGEDPKVLSENLIGVQINEESIIKAIEGIEVDDYFKGLSKNELKELLLDMS